MLRRWPGGQLRKDGRRKEAAVPMRIGFDSFHRLGMLCAPNSEDEMLWQN
jgi:hypothetical protein